MSGEKSNVHFVFQMKPVHPMCGTVRTEGLTGPKRDRLSGGSSPDLILWSVSPFRFPQADRSEMSSRAQTDKPNQVSHEVDIVSS